MNILRAFTAVCLASVLSFVEGNAAKVKDVADDHYSIIDQPFKEILTLKPGMDLSNMTAIVDAVNMLVPAYNNVMANKSDTYHRRMVSISITNVTLITSNRRDLADSYAAELQALHQQSARVKVLGKSNGICRNCMGIKLSLSVSGRRRKLNTINALTPTFEKIVEEQNILIAASNNTSVDHVNALWARVAILASQAQTASMNANTHEKYLENLKKQLDVLMEKIEARKKELNGDGDRRNLRHSNQNLRSLRDLLGFGGFIFAAGECSSSFCYALDDELARLQAEYDLLKMLIEDAEAKLVELKSKALQLKEKTNNATQKALEAERQVAQKAKSLAMRINKNIATNVKFSDVLDKK